MILEEGIKKLTIEDFRQSVLGPTGACVSYCKGKSTPPPGTFILEANLDHMVSQCCYYTAQEDQSMMEWERESKGFSPQMVWKAQLETISLDNRVYLLVAQSYPTL